MHADNPHCPTSLLCKCNSNPPTTRAAMCRQGQLGEPPWPSAATRLQNNNWQNIVHMDLLPVVYGDSWRFATGLVYFPTSVFFLLLLHLFFFYSLEMFRNILILYQDVFSTCTQHSYGYLQSTIYFLCV